MREYASVALHQARKARGFVEPRILVLIGPPGLGKSELAERLFTGDPYYKCCEHRWWDLYNGERTIVLEDYNGQFMYSHLLKLLDGRMNVVETKGGFTALNNDIWVITSNDHPENWYPKIDDVSALKDRLWPGSSTGSLRTWDCAVWNYQSMKEIKQ